MRGLTRYLRVSLPIAPIFAHEYWYFRLVGKKNFKFARRSSDTGTYPSK